MQVALYERVCQMQNCNCKIKMSTVLLTIKKLLNSKQYTLHTQGSTLFILAQS